MCEVYAPPAAAEESAGYAAECLVRWCAITVSARETMVRPMRGQAAITRNLAGEGEAMGQDCLTEVGGKEGGEREKDVLYEWIQ